MSRTELLRPTEGATVLRLTFASIVKTALIMPSLIFDESHGKLISGLMVNLE